jgi:peptide/nickel transport system substrate-binding protein
MRTLLPVVVIITALFAATGCGGGAASGGGGGGSTSGGILRVGTINIIDSLNPFTAIESQSYNAFVMEYPQLVQYGPGAKGPTLEGDWATSWTHSTDGKTWTFKLKPGGKWSDGKPLTAEDAAWTGNTIIKYKDGPSALVAAALTHVSSMSAPNATTLVIHYDAAVGNVLSQLEQFWVLPEHVWSKYTGNNGKNLKTFQPQDHLPTVAGGAYYISSYASKGTTVFKPNPYFYGPKSHAQAVAMVYYTNATTEIADMESNNLDFVDQVPYNAVSSLKGDSRYTVYSAPSSEVTNITFNSNPVKPKNRELLDPKVREALEYATDRNQIVNIVYAGYATPWANNISSQSTIWLDPSIKPLPYDIAKANQILDSLGLKKNSDGIREVPATTGKYAQPAHEMSYDLMVPGSLDFNSDRQFQIIANGWLKAGVKIHEFAGGDTAAATQYEYAGNYTKYDLAMWDWAEYIDPDAQMSYMTKSQWLNWSDTGYDNPTFDQEYTKQATLVNFKQRQALIFKMERQIHNDRPYIQLVDEDLVTASDKQWTGFEPDLNAYCKCYYTSPHQTTS